MFRNREVPILLSLSLLASACAGRSGTPTVSATELQRATDKPTATECECQCPTQEIIPTDIPTLVEYGTHATFTPRTCNSQEPKPIRLTYVNYSNYDVYQKLEGAEQICVKGKLQRSFYYLTVKEGTKEEPTVKVFTLYPGMYHTTTWKCNGDRNKGTLILQGNSRQDYRPCDPTLTPTH